MRVWQLLKVRLGVGLVLATFALALLAPVSRVEAAWSFNPSSFNNGLEQNVSWNSGTVK